MDNELHKIQRNTLISTAGRHIDKIWIHYFVKMHPLWYKHYMSQEIVLNAGVFINADQITGL